MAVIGITGTNGKTSTGYLIKGMYAVMGLKTGIITNVAHYIHGENLLETKNTVPDDVAMGEEGGDIVVVTGKRHETYDTVGETTEYFDDRDECREALQYVDELHQSEAASGDRSDHTPDHLSNSSMMTITKHYSQTGSKFQAPQVSKRLHIWLESRNNTTEDDDDDDDEEVDTETDSSGTESLSSDTYDASLSDDAGQIEFISKVFGRSELSGSLGCQHKMNMQQQIKSENIVIENGSISRKWLSPKLQKKPQKRSVLSQSKIRTLSSIGGGDLRAEEGAMKLAAAAVACIPVKLVFSRLHEELVAHYQ